ncbi:hypothetical protein [Emticicia sp. W12TSBA100-4]|uniref:hypothetical protein n=1 Tax=Emticicia sp. W12TSBA100-4 TaxID=3160965 RepID=UPI003305E73B
MKKLILFYSLFMMIESPIFAQSFLGNWQGQVKGSNGSLKAELLLKTANANQLSGQMVVFSGGETNTYQIKGNTAANTASGTLTYNDGTVFTFVMQLQNNAIQQKISYNNQVILEGSFAKATAAVSPQTNNTAVKPDGLYRDPNLVGKWTNQENYSSNGGFYGGSSTSIILNADGTIDDGGSSSYVSGPNSSGNSSGGGNSAIAQVKAAGARWFTKGNILYWRVNVNGKITDVANSKYYIERGALLLTDVNTGKKMLYYKGK